MFKDIIRLTKHSAVYGIGNILSRSLSFLLLPLYSNVLPTAEYGKVGILFAYLAFFNVIFLYGLDTTFLRFYILKDENNDPKETFSTAFISLFVTNILFCSLIFIFSGNIAYFILESENLKNLIQLAIIIIFFDTLSVLPFLILRAEERSKQFVLLKFITIAVNLLLNIYLVAVIKMGIKGIFLSNAVSSCLSLILVFNIILTKFRFRFSRKLYSVMLKFALPYIFPGISIICMEVIDREIIKRILGFEENGIYSAAYKLGMFMSLIVASFRFAWHPFFLSIANREDAKRIYAKILTYFLYITLWAFLVISVFINLLVKIRIKSFTLLGQEYWSGINIIPYVLFAYILYGVYVNFIIGIYLKKKSGYLPYITGISALTNILLNIVLIPRIGILGAAIATTFSYGVMALILYFLVQRIYYIQYEWIRIVKLLCVTALLFYIGYYVEIGNEIMWKLIISISYPILLGITLFYDRQEIRKIKNLFKHNI